MIYNNTKNRKKFIEAIKDEARNLGIDLVTHGLDRTNIYFIDRFKTIDHLIKSIRRDIRFWFSSDKLSKKEMCITIHTEPWGCESVHIKRGVKDDI